MEFKCGDCDAPNPVWFAPNSVWNLVMGGPDAKGDPGGIICPNCFLRRADAAGFETTGWVLAPEKPTKAMLGAINVARSITRADDDEECEAIWRAALSVRHG